MDLDKIDRLLIVKTSSIGDVIHALPVVQAIKKARPQLVIGWVVRRRCVDALTGNPSIDSLHIVENKPRLADLIRMRRELHAGRYQCALDMQGLFLSGLYAWMSGAPVRIGIDRNREMNRLFLTHPIVPGRPEAAARKDGVPRDRHAVDILYGFAEALGIQGAHSDFAVQDYLASDPPVDFAEPIQAMDRPLIGLNVGASSPYKRWPTDHWIALAESLAALGYGMAFIGDKRDAESVRDVLSGMRADLPAGQVLDLSGKTSLRELASVLAVCDVVVSGDTGPLHIAVAVGTPVVALFGSTNPDRTGPYGERNVVLNVRMACSPCYRRPTCDGRVDCMQAITPDMVAATIKSKLSVSVNKCLEEQNS